jgi:hypothetical protein
MSIAQTPDKGFILAGWAWDASMTPAQQMWLIKTDSMGCDTPGCDITSILNPEYRRQEGMNVYPNPANNNLFIEPDTESREYFIELINISGQVLKQKRKTGKTEIDISELPPGLYFLKCTLQNMVMISKLIVQ